MSDNIEYFNQNLWQFNDKQVSQSTLSLQYFSVVDEWGNSPLKMKIGINQFKGKVNNYVYLSQSDVYLLLHKLQVLNSGLSDLISKINDNHQTVSNYSIKLKKNIIVSFLYRTEYNGPCIRIIISDKNDNYLDSEKLYMPIFDFLGLIKVLINFRDAYSEISIVSSNTLILNKICDQLKTLNEKSSSYYGELINTVHHNDNSSLKPKTDVPLSKLDTISNVVPEEKVEIADDPFSIEISDEPSDPLISGINPEDAVDMPQPKPQMIEESEDDSELNKFQSSFDNFVLTEAPKVNLNVGEIAPEAVKPVVDKSAIFNSDFTEKVLKNNILNLEMYITNMINDEVPFDKFCCIIKQKMNMDPLDGVMVSEINAMNYILTNHLKHNIKNSVERKIDLPANVSPIIFSNHGSDNKTQSLAYDLFLYFIYYTQLKNVLKDKDHNPIANKDFICFCFKTIASPIVISMFNKITEKALLSEMKNRYIKYCNDGVFDKLKEEIESKYHYKFDLSMDFLMSESARVFNAIQSVYDHFTIENAFKKFTNLQLKLNYQDFINFKFDTEQIKKIMSLEFNIKQNGKIDYSKSAYSSFDDIPSDILIKYDISEKKYDNSNLKRYVKELTADNLGLQDSALKIVSNINHSYRDLKDVNVDLTMLPLDVLKSIYLWDIEQDPKIVKNYLHYRDIVQNCTLTKDMLISSLTNIQDLVDDKFVDSFKLLKL